MQSYTTAAPSASSNESSKEQEIIRRFLSNFLDSNNNPSLLESMRIVQYVPNNIKSLPPIEDRSNPLGTIGDGYDKARTDRQQRKKISKIIILGQECILYAHKQHQYTPINGFYEKCCLEALEIVEYEESIMNTIKNEIYRIPSIINSYEVEAADVKNKIKESKRCHAQAIKDREKYLLNKVEHIRQTKTNELSDYMAQMQSILAGFGRINESLEESMDAEETELTTTKKSSRSQVEYFTAIFQKMGVTEERVAFVLPDDELMEIFKIILKYRS
ncbi:unnamed protein product [Diatraea saccharalis]|uniref:Uncharacterized protein n=1 Tax=Diatraea saccharalis TaxID=40085 RepID=A0A9P1FBA9_9NEOP|nr:unnamed protein product [Diatraea saccharalis]